MPRKKEIVKAEPSLMPPPKETVPVEQESVPVSSLYLAALDALNYLTESVPYQMDARLKERGTAARIALDAAVTAEMRKNA